MEGSLAGGAAAPVEPEIEALPVDGDAAPAKAR
jgi:hypothetical protein